MYSIANMSCIANREEEILKTLRCTLKQSRLKLEELDEVREKLAVAEKRIKELEGKVANDGARVETHTSSASENISDTESLDHWYWLVPKKDEFRFVNLNYEQKTSVRNSCILPKGLLDTAKWTDDVGIHPMHEEEVRRCLEDIKGRGLWFGEK